MGRTRILPAAATVLAFAVMPMEKGGGVAQAQHNGQVPRFEYDPTWPKPFPNETWAIGPAAGLAVEDHVWLVHRPGILRTNERFTASEVTPPKAECCAPASPVLEFDHEGVIPPARAVQ